MKAVSYEETGSADNVLRYGDMDVHEPLAGEVGVELMTSGVDPSDVKTRAGAPGPLPPMCCSGTKCR